MIRVLVVDDSAVVRQVFQKGLSQYEGIEVIGTAPDPFIARDIIVQKEPDVVTLDIEMPRMDGLTFLRRLMHYHPMPVIVVSSLTTSGSELAMQALGSGAVAVLNKPGSAFSPGEMLDELVDNIRVAASVRLNVASLSQNVPQGIVNQVGALSRTTERVVTIGASTGGTVALEQILSTMPPNAPGMIVTQHMPAVFTRHFAQHLNDISAMQVREAEDGDSVVAGVALVAPGDRHMLLRRSGARYYVQVKDGPRVNRHKPSVDVMFRSVAQVAGANAVGVILTGMGGDGAAGLLEMRNAGAPTLAQDEESCVVFGMPKVAIEMNAASRVVPLSGMTSAILQAVCTDR